MADGLAQPSTFDPDPVIEAYKRDVDVTLIRENLKLTVEQRVRNMTSFVRALEEIRGAARHTSKDSG